MENNEKWMGQNEAINDIDSNKVCDCYHGLINRTSSFEDAMKFYKRGIDWCLKNNSPSIDYLRNYKERCEKIGVYIDKTFNGEIIEEHSRIVFMNCSGNCIIHKSLSLTPEIYIAYGSNISVTMDDDSPMDKYYY